MTDDLTMPAFEAIVLNELNKVAVRTIDELLEKFSAALGLDDNVSMTSDSGNVTLPRQEAIDRLLAVRSQFTDDVHELAKAKLQVVR